MLFQLTMWSWFCCRNLSLKGCKRLRMILKKYWIVNSWVFVLQMELQSHPYILGMIKPALERYEERTCRKRYVPRLAATWSWEGTTGNALLLCKCAQVRRRYLIVFLAEVTVFIRWSSGWGLAKTVSLVKGRPFLILPSLVHAIATKRLSQVSFASITWICNKENFGCFLVWLRSNSCVNFVFIHP